MKHGKRPSKLFSALDFERNPPSIANLPAALTINGMTVYPTFRYKGGDAGSALWKPWGYGEILTLVGAGNAPTYNNGSPLLGALDDSVKLNTAKYYTASNNAFADITTEDIVFEIICDTGYNATMLSKSNEAGARYGYLFGSSSTYSQGCNIYNNGSSSAVSGGSSTARSCVHLLVFIDRSGSGQMYINGVASGAAVASIAATITSATPFLLGSREGQVEPFDQRMYYAAMWKGQAWLDTHLQATVAATRFAQLTGIYPQSARGTYLPTAVTRSSAGYLDKIEADGTTKLYYVNSNWPRVCSRKDSLGTKRIGYLSETSAQNVQIQSQTFATTWTPVAATVPTTAVVCPDGVTRTTCTLHEDATAGTVHYIYMASVAGTCFSVFVKAVNRSWFRITHNAGYTTWFNVANGTIGTTTATAAGIIPYGNGWYRCYAYYAAGASANTSLLVGPADNVAVFDGLNQDSVYIFGAQAELGNYPSSYIPTTTAAVTRSADLLRYKMNDGNMSSTRGSLECNVLLPNIAPSASGWVYELDNGGNTERAEVYTTATAGVPVEYVRNTASEQATVTGTSDIWNNVWNKVRGIWGPNDARILVNSVSEGTPDTAVTVPTGITQLEVGTYRVAGNELNGLISDLKILLKNSTKG